MLVSVGVVIVGSVVAWSLEDERRMSRTQALRTADGGSSRLDD
jgi:hypothetical protein